MIWDDNEMETDSIHSESDDAAQENGKDDSSVGEDISDEGLTDDEKPADAVDQEAEESSGEDEGDASDEKTNDLVAELKDKIMRQMAEFDNYRKRTEKEKALNYEIGASDFILKLLPVVDNFERAIDVMSDDEKASSFGQGVEMIYKQLMKVLEDEKVTEIEALGIPFDPAFHNAVMQQESEEYESGMVMQVMQKGYMYRDRVLRHSMVMVAQ